MQNPKIIIIIILLKNFKSEKYDKIVAHESQNYEIYKHYVKFLLNGNH